MCMQKEQKNEYNVLKNYEKYKVNGIENYKNSFLSSAVHDGNILTIFFDQFLVFFIMKKCDKVYFYKKKACIF